MTGNSGADDEQEYSATAKTNVTISQTQIAMQSSLPNDSEVETSQTFSNGDSSFSVTDTIAAIVSAILALVFLIMIVCLVQVIKRRRQERQENRLNRQVIQSITTQTFGVNSGAYQHVPISNTFSWESVASIQPTVSPTEQLHDAESAYQSSERTLHVSLSSESILITAILHPPPLSMGIDPPENIHLSPQRDSVFKTHSTEWLLESPSTSSARSTFHILSNPIHNRIFSDASGSADDTDEINCDKDDVYKEPSTSHG